MTNFREPLLEDNPGRFVLFPNRTWWHLVFLQKIRSFSFWTAEEIDLHQDLSDWENRLNDDEKHFIKHVLAFFAASDGIVNENLAENMVNEVQYTRKLNSFMAFKSWWRISILRLIHSL